MTIAEKQVQSKIIGYLRTVDGIWFTKTIVSTERGTPDIICCYMGRFLGIEVKRKGGVLSENQHKVKSEITRCGGVYTVAHDVSDVIRAIIQIKQDPYYLHDVH